MINNSQQYLFWHSVIANSNSGKVQIKGTINDQKKGRVYSNLRFSLEEDSKVIRQYSRDRNLEQFVLLTTALSIALEAYKYGSESIVIDTPLLKKNDQPEIRHQHHVPLIFPAQRPSTLRQAIEEANDIIVKSYTNQNFPLMSDVTRDNSQAIEMTRSNMLIHDSIIHIELDGEQYDKYEIVIDILGLNSEGQIEIGIAYHTGTFEEWFIQSLIGHWKNVIAYFNDLSVPLSTVRVRTEEEEIELIQVGQPTLVLESRSVIAQFEEQVNRNPEATALVFKKRALSYSIVSQKVDRLASFIISEYNEELQRNKYVGVFLERSDLSVIAFLAILKAGGIYVPIDPAYPHERVEYFINDSGLAVVLSSTDYFYELTGFPVKVVAIDLLMDQSSRETVSFPPINQFDPAYLIYTSGSSGNPKGVVGDHQSLVNLAHDHVTKLKLGIGKNVLQSHSHAFDASILDFVMILTSGATMVIIENQILHNMELCASFLDDHNVHLMTVSPSYLNNFGHRPLKNMNTIITGGEKAIIKDAQFYHALGITYFNAYGPTECTVNASLYKFDPYKAYASVPIGKPGHNKNIYILNSNLELMPKGAIGEICIAGIGVASGYLNKPEETCDRFVEDPFWPGQRLYRTGDFGRWLDAGNVEFFGRYDDQVKINGIRIELGEIEKVMERHPLIADAIAMVEKDAIIVAFYKLKDKGEQISDESLTTYLKNFLPTFMLPGVILSADTIPLTVEGKVDKKALHQLYSSQQILTANIVDAATEMEKLVVTELEKLLERRVSTDANFFQIGGDSLKAIQFSSKLHMAGYKVEVQDLFESPIIRDLALRIRKLNKTENSEIEYGYYSLTPIQREIISNGIIYHDHYNQSVCLKLTDRISLGELETVLQVILEHHDVFRSRFNLRDEASEVYLGDLDHAFECREMSFSEKDPALVEEFLFEKAEEMHASINLQNGPVIQVGLFHLKDLDTLLIIANHFVIDSASWSILADDLNTLIKQVTHVSPMELPERSSSFKQWVEGICEFATAPQLLGEQEYWSKVNSEMKNLIPALQSSSPNEFKDTEYKRIEISDHTTDLFLGAANRSLNTESRDLFLTVLAKAFHAAFGYEQTCILLEGHGRENIIPHLDISRTVGWFSSFFPVVLQYNVHNTIEENIVTNKENLRRIPNRGIGYGILKHLTPSSYKAQVSFDCTPKISVNYFGKAFSVLQFSSFDILPETYGTQIDPRNKRSCEIDLTGSVVGKFLMIEIAYNNHLYKSDSIEKLGRHIKQAMDEFTKYCIELPGSKVTPSDLTFKGLSLEDLETILE